MHQILVAVFDTVANADRAVQALEHASVSSASIRRYHRDDPAMENIGTGKSTYVVLRCLAWVATISVWKHEIEFGCEQVNHGFEVAD